MLGRSGKQATAKLPVHIFAFVPSEGLRTIGLRIRCGVSDGFGVSLRAQSISTRQGI